MKTFGIRIFDGEGNILSVTLSDILREIGQDPELNWCILFLDGTPQPGQGLYLTEYEKRINDSKNGIFVSWEELNDLSERFYQMFETIVLGCKDVKLLHRYEEQKIMYKTCDIVLDLIDCVFWEVYTKDRKIIDRLSKKFEKIEFLDPDIEMS